MWRIVMKKTSKKILTSLLTLALTFVFVTGAVEIFAMSSGHPVIASVLGSDGDYVPPTPPSPPTPAEKKSNPMSAKGKTVNVTIAALSSKSQTISRKKAIAISNAKGTVTYAKKSGNNKITINRSTGKITVKKGLGKGTYKLRVNVKASGNSSYKAKTVTVTVTIKVVTASNPMTVSANPVNLTVDDVATEDAEISLADAVDVEKAKGTVTYKMTIGSEGISVDPSSGRITVDQGLAPGTYKVEIKVRASGNSKYKSGSKYVIVTIRIKDPSAPDAGSIKLDNRLILTMTAKGSSSLVLKWNKAKGAQGYDIFLNKCGKTTKFRKVKSVSAGKTVWTKKGLRKATGYKAVVKAWKKVNGKKKYFKVSTAAHAFTSGVSGAYTNSRSVSVNRREILLKGDGSFRIKANVKKLRSGKKLMPGSHIKKIRYYSGNNKVATVSKRGVITAQGKGTCRIYVIASNGAYKTILVTVLD